MSTGHGAMTRFCFRILQKKYVRMVKSIPITTVSILPVMFRTYAALGWSIKVGYYALIVGSVLVLLNKVLKYLLRVVGR